MYLVLKFKICIIIFNRVMVLYFWFIKNSWMVYGLRKICYT